MQAFAYATSRRAFATKSFSVSVAQLLGARSRQFESISIEAPISSAVDRMIRNNVGSLIVLDTDISSNSSRSALRGIITERDILKSFHVAKDRPVSDIMTSHPVTVEASATVGQCLEIMTDEANRFRHLPVTDGVDGELVGVLSIRDLCDSLTNDHREEVRELAQQLNKMANIVGEDINRYSIQDSWTAKVRDLLWPVQRQTSS